MSIAEKKMNWEGGGEGSEPGMRVEEWRGKGRCEVGCAGCKVGRLVERKRLGGVKRGTEVGEGVGRKRRAEEERLEKILV